MRKLIVFFRNSVKHSRYLDAIVTIINFCVLEQTNNCKVMVLLSLGN